MNQCYFALAFVISCLLWTLVVSESLQPKRSYHEVPIKREFSKRMASESAVNQSITTTTSSTNAPSKKKREDPNRITDEQMKQNEIGVGNEDNRIVIVEPYKTLIQSAVRFALAQAKVTKHLNIETAMNLLNNAAYFLSKPVVLLKAIKVAVVTIAAMLATMFLFPGAHRFAENALNDPLEALNLERYLTNGLQERSVLAAIGSKTDETLSRVGLQDNSCRQRSLCYLGEIFNCSFPQTSESIVKFAKDNLAGTSIKENIYARAFISGFVERNCTGIGSVEQGRNGESQHCLSSFFSSILGGIESRSDSSPPKK